MIASSAATRAGVRRAPVQERSARRLSAILDAAAGLLDDGGYDAATTTEIARRAGISIGSLYRFFDDKAAVYRALAVRHLEEFLARLERRLGVEHPESPESAADISIDLYVEMRRSVPGFRGFGDIVDTHLIAGDRDNDTVLAEQLLRVMTTHYGVEASDRTRLVMLTAVTIADAVLGLAFRLASDGDKATIDQAAIAVRRYLGDQL